MNRTICLTFDLDCISHSSGKAAFVNEFETVRRILPVLRDYGVRPTWFIRIDRRTEDEFGNSDYFFAENGSLLNGLEDAGDEIGWHYHAWRKTGGTWKQNTNEAEILAELPRYAEIAAHRGLKSVRMGWGFHTNVTMKFISESGFIIDSSAIPRPKYKWEKSVKDWENAPTVPYRPSASDYRIPGKNPLNIIEIPISVAKMELPSDEEKEILRYINPAYTPNLFATAAAEWLAKHNYLVSIAHPYEFEKKSGSRLFAGNIGAFRKNIEKLAGYGVSFTTLAKFAETLKYGL